MNITNRFLTAVFAVTLSWSAQGSDLAVAASFDTEGTEREVWVGNGVVYDANLHPIKSYTITGISEGIGNNQKQGAALFRFSDGSERIVTCIVTEELVVGANVKRSAECNIGSGGGMTLGSVSMGHFDSHDNGIFQGIFQSTSVRDDGGERTRAVAEQRIGGELIRYWHSSLTRVQ